MDTGAKHNNEGVYFFNIPRTSSDIRIPDLCCKIERKHEFKALL